MRCRVLAMGALAVAAGCHLQFDQNVTGEVGTYPLVAIDGNALPAQHGTSITVRGALQLDGNGRYTLTQTDTTAGAPSFSSFSSQGTWVLTNTTLQFSADDGTFRLGSTFRDTVRITLGANTNTYVKP